jgi:hypothetical protein
MGKDGIDLLIAIKKRPNFRTQRDCKIQDEIDGNSLGNRCTPATCYHFATELLNTKRDRAASSRSPLLENGLIIQTYWHAMVSEVIAVAEL